MASTVYLLRIADWKDFESVAAQARPFLAGIPIWDGIVEGRPAAVKLTFGERGNRAYPPVPIVREVVSAVRDHGGRPFLTETNTLYRGNRMNAVDHLELAARHGFTIERVGAPIILGDGLLGRESYDVPATAARIDGGAKPAGNRAADAGRANGTLHLSPVLKDTSFLFGIAHVTGHLLMGYGGAVKNIGMGLASRAGKLDMHSVVCPAVRAEKCTLCLECAAVCPASAIAAGDEAAVIDAARCTGCAECLAACPTGAMGIDWNEDARAVQERLAEYAFAVAETVGRRMAFVNLLNHISDHCDCIGETPRVIAPDLGILASCDPVALDQASLDLTARAAGRDPFREAWPQVENGVQLQHAEALGLGTRSYELKEVRS